MARLLAAFIVASSSTPVLTRRGWTADSLRAGQGIAPGAPDQPATALPLTGKAQAAAARFSTRDNPLNECVAPTTPESIGVPYLHAAPVMGMDRWRNTPELELLSNECDLEVAHRYLDGE